MNLVGIAHCFFYLSVKELIKARLLLHSKKDSGLHKMILELKKIVCKRKVSAPPPL